MLLNEVLSGGYIPNECRENRVVLVHKGDSKKEGSKDLGLHVVELSGDKRRLQIEITIYSDSLLFISAGFLPRVISHRLN